MEPFRLNPQAVAFLAVIALLSGALVFLAPLALLIMSGVGLMLLLAAWVKAIARERKLFASLSAGEGAVVFSVLILVVGSVTAAGMLVFRLGAEGTASLTGAMFPISSSPSSPGPRIGHSSRHFSDSETQKRFKDELAKAGIPFETRMQEGREFVGWPPEHNAAVEAIDRKIEDSPLPAGRAMGFGSADTHKEFAEWLSRRGVKSETVRAYDRDYLVWDEGAGDPRELMEAFMKDQAKRCKETAQGPAAARC